MFSCEGYYEYVWQFVKVVTNHFCTFLFLFVILFSNWFFFNHPNKCIHIHLPTTLLLFKLVSSLESQPSYYVVECIVVPSLVFLCFLSFQGILLKGGHVLDALASCDTIAFDKTGTLTTGELRCKAIEPIHGHHMGVDKLRIASCCIPNCEKEALAVASAMERGTTHPIGRYFNCN